MSIVAFYSIQFWISYVQFEAKNAPHIIARHTRSFPPPDMSGSDHN